jgi:Spherulation-specific family 4
VVGFGIVVSVSLHVTWILLLKYLGGRSLRIHTQSIVAFYIIINPNSGPGAAGSQPDTNYQACIAQLRTAAAANGNLKVLGYVPTGYAAASSAGVMSEIDTYSQWSSAYRPDGIFFDEVSQLAADLPLYQSYSSRVHNDFGTSFVSY